MYIRGFTPSQLAIGQNPKISSAFYDELHDDDYKFSNCKESQPQLHWQEKNFFKLKSVLSLGKALKHPVRSYADTIYK